MQTAIEFYRAIPEGMPRILDAIQAWLRDLPDRGIDADGEGLWHCHALTRATKLKWQLKRWRVTDGFFCRVGTNHSWLVRDADREFPRLILDVYPVRGFRMPLLIEANEWGSPSPWNEMYIEMPGFFANHHRQQWERDANLILAASHSR